MSTTARTAVVAWLITAVYYFYQYTLRSAPAVMMPQLSDAFGISATAVASMVGLFYYGYSPFSLVAGAAMDRLGTAEGRADRRRDGRHRRAALRDREQSSWPASAGSCRAPAACSRSSARPISRPRTSPPRAPRRSSARRRCSAWPAVPPGQFVVGPMIGSGVAVEHVLDRHGHRRPRDQRRRCSSSCPRRSHRTSARIG